MPLPSAELLTAADAQLVHPPLCMTLRTCSRGVPERQRALATHSALLGQLLRPTLSREDDEQAEWLGMLLADLCFSGGRLGEAYSALGSENCSAGRPEEAAVRCAAQGRLLSTLAEALDAAPTGLDAALLGDETSHALTLAVLLDILEDTARSCARRSAEHSPSIDSLRGALALLRSLSCCEAACSRLDAGALCALSHPASSHLRLNTALQLHNVSCHCCSSSSQPSVRREACAKRLLQPRSRRRWLLLRLLRRPK